MNKQALLWIIGVLVFVLLMVGVYFLFQNLSGMFGADSQLATVNEENNPLKGKTEGNKSEAPTNADGEKTEVSAKAVPDFTVYDGAGNACKLSDCFGKPIVLNLWASWCAPCKNEMPGFQQMYEKYGDQVQFLMVNVTGIDKADDAKAFIKESGYSFPVYFDTDNSMAANYYAGSVPMTYFIGSNGELVTYATGAIPADTLEQGISMTLE